MTAQEGRGLADPSGKPVVDLAAPRLRTRCCGDSIDRGENHDPGQQKQKKELTNERRLENDTFERVERDALTLRW